MFFSTIFLLLISYRRLFGTGLIPLNSPAVHYCNTFQGFFSHTTYTEAEVYITYSIKELRGAPIKSFTVSSSPQEADDMARGGSRHSLISITEPLFFFPQPFFSNACEDSSPWGNGCLRFHLFRQEKKKKRRGRKKKKERKT